MRESGRIKSLDVLRGTAMMFVILFHSAVYNYANIHLIDFSNPPLIIILMSFMALWGGIFIIYSMTVNTVMLAARNEGQRTFATVRHLASGSAIYLVLHYALNMVFGRWNVDFVNNQPDMTLVASVLRGTGRGFPPISELFEGSSLATIGLNLVLVSVLVYWLLGGGGQKRASRNYWILGLLGTAIMIGSFTRVQAYALFAQAKEAGNFTLSIIGSFLLANPYPLLPYLGYGCFGAMIGLMIHNKRPDLLAKVVLPAGLAFLVYGVAGMTRFDKTISTPDFFWYCKTNFELGVFLLLIPGAYLLLERRRGLLSRLSVVTWFSRVSLTIYMLETTLSEVLRLVISPLIPAWDQTINGCLLFGAANIAIWGGILWLWRRSNFKYSLEYFWVAWMERRGKASTKMLP